MKSVPFSFTYVPRRLSDIEGQEKAVERLQAALKKWKPGGGCFLLYGPPGTGKTAIAFAAAHEFNLDLIEMSASDFRDAEQIQGKAGNALQQQSLFQRGKLILIDEVDGIAGNEDRGGVGAVAALLEKPYYPVILTAENPWEHKLQKIRKACEMIEIGPLSYSSIAKVLAKICEAENIRFDVEVLKSVARRAGGDCRAAINDLQSLTAVTWEVTSKSLELLEEREQQDTMPEALVRILKSTDLSVALPAFDHVSEDTDEQILWLEENIPFEYDKPADVAGAFDALSKADVFRRRIRRWQHWRFLVYINALLTGGVALAKGQKYHKMVQYKPTGRLLKIWWGRQKALKKESVASALGQCCHSSKKAMVPYVGFYRKIFKHNKKMGAAIARQLELDKEEIAWMEK